MPDKKQEVICVLDPEGFTDWEALLDFLKNQFSHTSGKINPPSTVYSTTPTQLASRAASESFLLSLQGDQIVGCLFMKQTGDELFLGRFAISPSLRGTGLARRIIRLAVSEACLRGLKKLSLETRVPLKENQAKFKSLGFQLVGGRAHNSIGPWTTLRMERFLGSCPPRRTSAYRYSSTRKCNGNWP